MHNVTVESPPRPETYALLEEYDQYSSRKINLDQFLVKVYRYYEGKGLFCIVLARSLSLLALAFMIFWTLFLFAFVDYGDLFTNYDLRTAIKFDINR
jgi:hypothetical protein